MSVFWISTQQHCEKKADSWEDYSNDLYAVKEVNNAADFAQIMCWNNSMFLLDNCFCRDTTSYSLYVHDQNRVFAQGIFRRDIIPEWTDDEHTNGSTLQIRIYNQINLPLFERIWLDLVFGFLDG